MSFLQSYALRGSPSLFHSEVSFLLKCIEFLTRVAQHTLYYYHKDHCYRNSYDRTHHPKKITPYNKGDQYHKRAETWDPLHDLRHKNIIFKLLQDSKETKNRQPYYGILGETNYWS